MNKTYKFKNWVELYEDSVEPIVISNSFFIAPDWIKAPKDNKKTLCYSY